MTLTGSPGKTGRIPRTHAEIGGRTRQHDRSLEPRGGDFVLARIDENGIGTEMPLSRDDP
jgi:hypothetical protein